MIDKKNPNLFWMIPLSTKIQKYKGLRDKLIEENGKCNRIIITKYDGEDSVFLPQSMFPVTINYISHVHKDAKTRKPLPIKDKLHSEIKSKAQELKNNFLSGKKDELIFTEIVRLKNLMLDELRLDSSNKTTTGI